MATGKIETVEGRIADDPHRALMIGVAALILTAAVGIAYWSERVERRWWEANHPFAEQKAGMKHMRATYGLKRANLAEIVRDALEILAEIPWTIEPERLRETRP
jgi:hypothetical protein